MIFGTIETTLLLVLATLFLGGSLYVAYKKSGDPLHPAVILSILFFLGMVLEPAQRLLHPEIIDFFPSYQGIPFAMTVQYIGMASFFAGMLSLAPLVGSGQTSSLVDISIDAAKRKKIRIVAWSLASFALAGYWYGIYMQGGFLNAYSYQKGGNAPMSGYFSEAQNLGVAAVVFYAISLQGKRIKLHSILIALIMISPTIFLATFGGRRGPMFITGASLFVSYFIAVGRVPRIRHIAVMLMVLLCGMVFIGSQRRHLHFGSDRWINWDEIQSDFLGNKIEPGDNFVASSGAVLAIHELDEYHFGRRLITTFLVRPIPRDLWPTKYDDICNVLYGKPFSEIQNSFYDWIDILGWRPTSGFAINAIVDLFWEFGWGYVIALWLFGRGIAELWVRFRTIGGFWFVGYFLVTALAIYLPTQSFSAFAHRFLYLSLMSYVFWRFSVGRESRRRVVRTGTMRSLPTLPRPAIGARTVERK